MEPYLKAAVGYTIIIGGVAVYWFYHNGKAPRRSALANQAPERPTTASRKEREAKNDRVKRKTQPKPPTTESTTTTFATETSGARDSTEEEDNREFARQYSNAKVGTKFAASSKDDKRPKSVKQSRAAEVATFSEAAAPNQQGRQKDPSAPSSTAGGDADDDQSPAGSPVLGPSGSSGVEDMLEKPAASGPGVLRLTDLDKVKEKKPKARAGPSEPAETKKQRQNRKKAEAAKAAREEAEVDRKVKLEAQRRLARESEGRAAKDGSGFMAGLAAAAAAPASVWGAGKTATNGASAVNKGASAAAAFQPLDTFSTSEHTPATTTGTASPDNPSDSWVSMNLSEEEQMQMIREEAEWNTVPAKKLKKKASLSDAAAANGDSTPTTKAESSAAATTTTAHNGKTAAKAPAPATSAPPANAKSTKGKTIASQSSFAALSSKENDLEEKEWDI